jgi:hypothetical protein
MLQRHTEHSVGGKARISSLVTTFVKGIALDACFLQTCDSDTTCSPYRNAAWRRASLPALEGFMIHAKLNPAF